MAMAAAMAVMVMVANNNSTKIRKLVRSVSDSSSTAELIVLISGDLDLLTLARALMDQVDQERPSKLTEDIRQVCAKEGIRISAFYAEIRNVLQALHLQESPQRAEYEILGLDPEATWEEVKKAYRKLSVKYHPDRAGQGLETEEKFIKISEAYHTLEKESKTAFSHPVNSWRKGHRRRDKGKQNRFIVTVIVVVLVLVLLSIFYTWQYRQKVYIQQVREFAGISGSQDGALSE